MIATLGIVITTLLAVGYTWWLLTRCRSKFHDYPTHETPCIKRRGHKPPHTDGVIRW